MAIKSYFGSLARRDFKKWGKSRKKGRKTRRGSTASGATGSVKYVHEGSIPLSSIAFFFHFFLATYVSCVFVIDVDH